MKSQMVGRDFLTLMDFSKEEVEYFLDTAAELKRKRRMGEPHDANQDFFPGRGGTTWSAEFLHEA